MGDTALPTMLCDTNGENHSTEENGTNCSLSNGVESTLSVQEGKSSREGVMLNSGFNYVAQQNGNHNVLKNSHMNMENRSKKQGQKHLGDSSQNCTQQLDCIQPLMDKTLKCTLSASADCERKHENGEDFSRNDLAILGNIEKEEGLANGLGFPSSISCSKPGFEESTIHVAMEKTMDNQAHTDASNSNSLESPYEFDQDDKKLEIFSIVDRECLGSSGIAIDHHFQSLDGVTKSNYGNMTGTTCTVIEASNIEHQDKSSSNDLEQGTQKMEKVVDVLKILKLQNDAFLGIKEDNKHSVWLGNTLEHLDGIGKVMIPSTVDDISIEGKLDGAAHRMSHLQVHPNIEEGENSGISMQDVDPSLIINENGCLDQGVPILTALVSSNMESWHRFDVEEENHNITASGTAISNQESHCQGLWEQLLEDGLEDKQNDEENLHAGLGGMESPLCDQNIQISFASPGNPFTDSLDRLSNFSETDASPNIDKAMLCFQDQQHNFRIGLASPGNPFTEGLDRLSNFSETEACPNVDQGASLGAKEGSTNGIEEKLSASYMLKDVIKSGGQLEYIAPVMGNLDTSELEAAIQFGSKKQPDTSINPFAEATRPSLDQIELFESPSFMSLVDPESHALFKASMPIFEIRDNVSGLENSGEKWEANFDLMMPSQSHIASPIEITRTVSLPRIDTGGFSDSTSIAPTGGLILSTTGVGNSRSLSSKPSVSPKAKSSVSLSPKLSPFVKKLVQKVRTTPLVASRVLHTVNELRSPKTVNDNPNKSSIWSFCMCCSNEFGS